MLGDEGKDRRAWLDIPLPVKELIAGGIAGGVAKTAVAPLERVKILFQTRRAEFQGSGLAGSFRKIFQTEGLLGFYRGNGASVARIIPYAALHYMSYEQYRRWIIHAYPAVNQGPVLDLMAGSISGATAVIFTYPLDLVRTKLAYQVRTSSKLVPVNVDIYKGILDCIEKVFRKNGIRGLYHGIAPSLYGIFPYAGLKFYFYEELKRRVPVEHKKNVFVNLACGSIAGLLSQTITYPLDVVRRQMQVQALAVPDQIKMRGTLAILITIARTQGWRQLFSGLSINYLKVVPSVAIGFTMYDLMKLRLEIPSRDKAAVARERARMD